jgi:diguanylate cyclase (GGDEF)-like protein
MQVPGSIGMRLKYAITGFVIIILAVAAVGIAGSLAIDHKAGAIGGKWLVATELLDELDDQVISFRVGETYRALAPDVEARASVDLLLAQTKAEIDRVLGEYVVVLGKDSPASDVESFQVAWQTYLAAHNAWVEEDRDGTHEEPARAGSSLHRLYRAAVGAAEHLIEVNSERANAEVRAADLLMEQTVIAMLVVSGLGLALAAWLVLYVRRDVTEPLAKITDALSRLAAGERDITVPERERQDEIGEMAKAFEVFRSNANALEEAHAATREAQEQAQSLARHDALTGLPNRRIFNAELENATSHSRSGLQAYSVLMIDLDRFKPVNDLQGHAVGDLVLCEVARRLRSVVRKGDVVARLGGDEFAIIAEVEQQSYPDMIIRLAGRVINVVREPILVGDSRIEIDASIGIATSPTDGVDSEGLLRAADIAMYRAKRDGRGTFRFFEQSMDEELRAQTRLEADLRKAIISNEIKPHYQPLVDMRENQIYGFEILARWQHPERGLVAPDVFVPLVEQLGMISQMTWSLLRQACRDASGWAKDIKLSLNVSPIQLKDPALPAQLLSVLNQEGFAPSRLEIELTENALVDDLETAKLTILALQGLGIKVSLDDFGTGYSSLYHLRELNFDKIKIDRSFVQSMKDNIESEKIVDAILSLAHSLGLPTVAEGIENPEALKHLNKMGCNFGQGYYFGKAMTAYEAGEVLGQPVQFDVTRRLGL